MAAYKGPPLGQNTGLSYKSLLMGNVTHVCHFQDRWFCQSLRGKTQVEPGSSLFSSDDHLAERIAATPGAADGHSKFRVQRLDGVPDIGLADIVHLRGGDTVRTLFPEHGTFGQADDRFFRESLDIPCFELGSEQDYRDSSESLDEMRSIIPFHPVTIGNGKDFLPHFGIHPITKC